ncbi:MAG: PadR family transcriptional regulator [Oscillospiraceae bacterium]|nr:PadR family transcriptional regulator [Oscillospiraceae bacterium]
MDQAQLMKGVLEGCVLAVIARGETYGYEILGVLESAGFADLGEGTLYPVLTRLDKAKLIVCRKAKSPLGPVRKYYSITEEGTAQLADFRARYNAMTQSVNRIITEGENGHDEL